MSDRLSNSKKIRFKFMPTPSGRLHVGHAWLLFVMYCLVKRAKQAGSDAEIVLVLDDLFGMSQNLSNDQITQSIQGIIDDMNWLGIPFSQAVNNSSYLYNVNLKASPIRLLNCSSMAHPSIFPGHLNCLMFGDYYYIKNCIIDAALEVSHIIRGADQLTKAATYKVYYDLLGMPSPMLVYLPLLSDSWGNKISKDGTYGIEDLKNKISRDELFSILTRCCLKSMSQAERNLTIEEAENELVGDDWDWILGNADGANKLTSFLNRLEGFPKISGEQLVANNSAV